MLYEKKIALVDDHGLVRAGLKGLLNSLDGYQVVSEGQSGKDAVAIARSGTPDIMVIDVSMPEVCGIEAIKQIRQHNTEIPLLMLSMYDSPEFVLNSLKHGADGYLLKDAPEHELKLALDYVHQKKPFVSPTVARHLIDIAVNSMTTAAPKDQLTERQQEVLGYIAQGLSTREIAEKLGVSIKTIESHRSQMMHRLGLGNGVELVRFALSAQSA
jgi:DNA-binding NarL/FixJ family response regulator